MSKLALVFPGQGSQFVGMGLGFAEDLLQKASDLLGFDLKEICLRGPEDKLKETEITQPAILTVSVAAFHKLGRTANIMAGHSLGEYSALVAAGAIAFEDAVKIVRLRGKFMQKAVPLGHGAMAAVLGSTREKINEICQRVGQVQAANFNSPGQVVISGKKEAVEKAGALLKEAGAKRIIPLAVSAPFHSALMKPAQDKLKVELDKIVIQNALVPVVANVNAQVEEKAGDIRRNLADQVTGSVQWEDSIVKMISLGVTTFVEVGPGKVLQGLIKKINPQIEVKSWEEML